MGYSLTEAFLRKGFRVCLVTGPVSLEPPRGAEVVRVLSSEEMLREITARIDQCDCLVMAAAVCDFAPEKPSSGKIKKRDTLNIRFVKNRDILGALRENRGFIKIGFALETEDPIPNAAKKLDEKALDLIVLNTLGEGRDPFGDSVTEYTFIYRGGRVRSLGELEKKDIADLISDESEELMRRTRDEKIGIR